MNPTNNKQKVLPKAQKIAKSLHVCVCVCVLLNEVIVMTANLQQSAKEEEIVRKITKARQHSVALFMLIT